MELEDLRKDLDKKPTIKQIYYRIYRAIFDIKDSVKFGFQRMFRNFDDTAYWSLYSYLTDIIIPVLKFYKKDCSGLPYNRDTKKCHTEKEWQNRLDKMIKAFEIIKKDDLLPYNSDEYKRNNRIVKEGLKEFADYYTALWD